MSWGELTCKFAYAAEKPCSPTMESCNKKCPFYQPKPRKEN
jgi:hypothetical protein